MIINKVYYNFEVNFTPRKTIEEVVVDKQFVTFKVYDESGHIFIHRTDPSDVLFKGIMSKKADLDEVK